MHFVFGCHWTCVLLLTFHESRIVDIHSHLGVDSAPELKGAADTNSLKGLVLPWLRSLDGLNTHDEGYRLSISGGVTTANVLPGSADAIGLSYNFGSIYSLNCIYRRAGVHRQAATY